MKKLKRTVISGFNVLLESLIISACIFGNSDGCQSGTQGYIKYEHLDIQLEEIGNNIHKKYTGLWYFGIVGAGLANKKYNAMIYKNIGISLDYSDGHNQNSVVYYRLGF